jgi:hypothetical protein
MASCRWGNWEGHGEGKSRHRRMIHEDLVESRVQSTRDTSRKATQRAGVGMGRLNWDSKSKATLFVNLYAFAGVGKSGRGKGDKRCRER